MTLVFFGAALLTFFTVPLSSFNFLVYSGTTSFFSSFLGRVTWDLDLFLPITYYSGSGSDAGGNFLFLRVI